MAWTVSIDWREMDPSDLERAEGDLTTQATVLRPEDLRTCVTRVIDCYDPDGQVERDQKEQALRQLRLISHRDGGYSIAGRLTGAVGAQLVALLSPLARPRPAEPAAVGDSAVVDSGVAGSDVAGSDVAGSDVAGSDVAGSDVADPARSGSSTAASSNGTATPSPAVRRLAEARPVARRA